MSVTFQLQSCEQVLAHPSLYDSLMLFSKTSHAILQKVIVKIVSCMTGHTDMRIQALSRNLDQVLLQIKHNAADREAWNMADTGMCVRLRLTLDTLILASKKFHTFEFIR